MKRTPIVHADERRVAMVLGHGSAVVVEAPAGFGKSHLLAALAEKAPHSVLITSSDQLATLADDPTSIDSRANIFVDVERPDPSAIGILADHDDVDMLVVAGRIVDRATRSILGRYDCLELGSDDLALSDAEIVNLLDTADGAADPTIVDVLREQTAGWPAVIVALADHGRHSRTNILEDHSLLRRGVAHHPVVDRLLRDTITDLPGELAHGLARFGLLENFTASAFDAVTEPGAIGQLASLGAPVLETADGWLRVPPILRTHLGDELDPSDAELIAPHLAKSGGLVPATQALVASGSLHTAAQLLTEAPRTDIDGAEPRSLLGVLDALTVNDGHAQLGLIRARIHENLGELREARDAIGATVTRLDPNDPAWVTARLEQLRFAAAADDIGPDDELIVDLTTPEHQTRYREVLGLRAAQSDDPDRVEDAIGLLEAAAGEWQALGDPARAGAVLRSMASIALIHLGRYPEAIDAATRARRLCSHRLYDRAVSTVLIVRLAALAGRAGLIEREITAARTLSASVQMPWLEHHLAVAMTYTSALGDKASAAAEWARHAEHTLGGLRDHSTATVFHAEIAIVLAMAGCDDAADHHLALARARRADNPVEVDLAEATVAARRSETDRARALVESLVADARVPATRLWRPRLELALATGNIEELQAAKATAEITGLAEYAERLATPSDDSISIRVLGGLEIRRAGERLINPTGKPAELLKLLVCRGGSVPVEQAVDLLWDDVTSTDIGIRRLKNPINRLREAVGADAIVRSGAAIHLGAGVDTDLARFTSAAHRASGIGGGREASMAAVDALNLYEPLLADEPHSELVANRSIDLVATASGLFDLVLQQPAIDRPSSAWLLDTARRIDLYAEPWFTEIARLAIEENNLVHARQALALAQAAAVELDLPGNPEVLTLLDRLKPESAQSTSDV